MTREVRPGEVLIHLRQSSHGGGWRWTANDSQGEMCAATFGRAELRQAKRDLELLLGCTLEPIKRANGRIEGYYAIGRGDTTRVEVER